MAKPFAAFSIVSKPRADPAASLNSGVWPDTSPSTILR